MRRIPVVAASTATPCQAIQGISKSMARFEFKYLVDDARISNIWALDMEKNFPHLLPLILPTLTLLKQKDLGRSRILRECC